MPAADAVVVPVPGASRFGFGGVRLTGAGTYGPPPDLDAARRAVRTAFDGGVRLFDTADCYGPEISERLLCEALHPYPEGVVISTKGGRLARGDDQWTADGRPEHLRQACDASLRRLRLDTIDVYQLNAIDPAVPFEESLGALIELRDAGKVRAIGLCNVDVDELERAQHLTPIVTVQDRFDLSTRDNAPVVTACERLGVALLAWFPPLDELTAAPGSALDRIASAHGATPAQIALAWMLRRSSTIVPLPGTPVPERMAEYLAASEIELTNDEDRELTSGDGDQ